MRVTFSGHIFISRLEVVCSHSYINVAVSVPRPAGRIQTADLLINSQTLPPAELCSHHRKRVIRTLPPGPKPGVLAITPRSRLYMGRAGVELAVTFSPAAYKAAALTAELPPQYPEAIFVSSPPFSSQSESSYTMTVPKACGRLRSGNSSLEDWYVSDYTTQTGGC